MIFNEKDIDAIEKMIENPEKYHDAIVLIRNIKEKILHWEETEDIVDNGEAIEDVDFEETEEDTVSVADQNTDESTEE